MIIKNKQKRVWAEIDLNAAEDNFRFIRGRLRAGAMLCCVIKANAYGHGAVRLAGLYESLGADWFAVSNIEEGIQLRDAGISKPVLILGYTPVLCAGDLARYSLSQCVYSEDYGRALSASAASEGAEVRIHVKIDTGMGRIGFQYREQDPDFSEPDRAAAVCRLPGLVPEGIFTHFASADEGEAGAEFTRSQYRSFVKACSYLEKKGVAFGIKHCANSAAIMDWSEYQMDMVRAGIILYGLKPSFRVADTDKLEPVMTLKSVVSHIKTIKPGDTVSYGRAFTAPKHMKVATVPLGYADGFLRSNTGRTELLVRGVRARVIGRVCMDQIMLDVTGVDGLLVGDEVTVFGSAPALTADELAAGCGTIGYETVCAVGERV
ncbi:MAG: alanine racemase, partial [Abditibacteriota bacterium]|nr:alanine racemase [Abditibacteriota bacterium]